MRAPIVPSAPSIAAAALNTEILLDLPDMYGYWGIMTMGDSLAV